MIKDLTVNSNSETYISILNYMIKPFKNQFLPQPIKPYQIRAEAQSLNKQNPSSTHVFIAYLTILKNK